MTEALFRDDAYLRDCEATVVAITDRGGVVLDRSVFYPTGGGQPGVEHGHHPLVLRRADQAPHALGQLGGGHFRPGDFGPFDGVILVAECPQRSDGQDHGGDDQFDQGDPGGSPGRGYSAARVVHELPIWVKPRS